MPTEKPDFGVRQLEIQLVDDEVAIYATEVGLRRLIELCQKLLRDPTQGHVHLEDYEVLTTGSKRAVICVFPPKV